MKDFTTPEYITPIIEEIKARFYPVTDNCVKAALNCDLLMQNRRSRDAFCVRAKQPFYYFSSSNGAMQRVYEKIKEYTEYAETEPGELHKWQYNEEKRVQHAIRDALLTLYA